MSEDYISGEITDTPDGATDQPAPASVKPLWAVGTSKEEVIEWNKNRKTGLYPFTRRMAETMLNNLMLYQSVHFQSQDESGDFRDRNGRRLTFETNKLVINEMHKYVKDSVARESRFTSNYQVVPKSGEHTDREGAQVTKSVIDTIEYQNAFERKRLQLTRDSMIFGGQFILPIWDDYKGDIDPRWATAKAKFEKGGLKKGAKVRVKGGDDFVFYPDQPIYYGDMAYPIPDPWQIFLDPVRAREDVHWFTWEEPMHVEQAVFYWPKFEEQIRQAGKKAYVLDFQTASMQLVTDQVMVERHFVRTGKFSLYGRQITTIGETVIEDIESKYPRSEETEFGNLPLVYLTDIDITGQVYGISTFQILAPLQHTLNQMYSDMKRNIRVAGSPKLLIPNQAQIKFESLADTITSIRYKHPYIPQSVTPTTIPAEVFAFVEQISKKFVEISGRSETSSGNLPANVRSGKQIALLEELEGLRQGERRMKVSDAIMEIRKKTKSTVGKFYKDDQKRLTRILGQDKSYMYHSFKVSDLSKPYDFQMVAASGLPELPQQRIAAVSEMFANPELRALYPNEMWAESLNLGEPGRFYDSVTASLRKAEWENEQLAQGKIPPPPHEGDDHIVHWKQIMTFIRSKSFLDIPDAQQEQAIRHAMTHEMFMFDHIEINPGFGQVVLTQPGLASFPSFYVPAPATAVPQPQPEAPAAIQQQTQAGEPQRPGNGDFLQMQSA